MGLDMYAYVAHKAEQRDEFYEGAEFDQDLKDFVNKLVAKPREIAYWRKHPDLHGWMEQLWEQRGKPGTGNTDAIFNGIELELTWEDLDNLEQAIIHKQLPGTSGFFFGTSHADRINEDLAFVTNARAEIFLGLKVFYNSSW